MHPSGEPDQAGQDLVAVENGEERATTYFMYNSPLNGQLVERIISFVIFCTLDFEYH